jgi:hypothetical protein
MVGLGDRKCSLGKVVLSLRTDDGLSKPFEPQRPGEAAIKYGNAQGRPRGRESACWTRGRAQPSRKVVYGAGGKGLNLHLSGAGG